MLMHVNMCSRDVLTFDAPVENPKEMLGRIKPAQLFNRPLHQFLGKYQTVSINPVCVEWIEVETNDSPDFKQLGGSVTIRQLTPETFQQRLNTSMGAIKAFMEEDVKTDRILAYGMATFRSGRSMGIEIQAKSVRAEDRVTMAQKVFGLPALMVQGEQGKLYIVNTANIASWQVAPGLKKSSTLSVPAELKNHQRNRA